MFLKAHIIRGLPGAGKSTRAENLRKEYEQRGESCEIWEADMFFMKNGEYKFNPKLLGFAHKWAMKQVAESKAEMVIVTGTFIRLASMKPYMKACPSRIWTAEDIVVDDVEIAKLADRNVHSVDNTTIWRMNRDFQTLGNSVYRERFVITDPPEYKGKMSDRASRLITKHHTNKAGEFFTDENGAVIVIAMKPRYKSTSLIKYCDNNCKHLVYNPPIDITVELIKCMSPY